MKKLLSTGLLLAAVLLGGNVSAQRIAFVNTKYILDQMPEYSSAQSELDRWSSTWQEEIDDRYAQIKRMRDAFNAEAILLTEEMKKSRVEEIERREREARDLQKKRFGVGGDLFKKRQELIQPIQDRIYEAVRDVAGTSYVAIFDIGGSSNNLLFASEKYDKSDSVLRKLGIRPGSNDGKDERGGGDEGDDPGDEDMKPQDGDRGGSEIKPQERGGNEVKPR